MTADKVHVSQRVRGAVFFLLYRLKRSLRWLGVEKIPGVTAIYRFLKRQLLPDGMVLVKSDENLLYVDLADEVVTPALVARAKREYEIELFASLLRPGMVVLDVGANIGHYTLVAARNVGEGGRVYAFEPEPRNYELLLKNISLNCLSNVTPVRKAVGDGDLTHHLYISKYNLGSHSFSSENTPDSETSIEVESVTLDHFQARELNGGKVDMVKLDTQGAESMVLDGANKLLSGQGIMIILECWPFGLKRMGSSAEELIEKLEGFGFHLTIFDEKKRCLLPYDTSILRRFNAEQESYGSHFGLLAEKPA